MIARMRARLGAGTAAAAVVVAAAALAGCDGESPRPEAAADAAWERFRAAPDDGTYEAFIRANRAAARVHDRPDDREGVAYQVRALEAQAVQAERAHDLELAGAVVERVNEIETRDLLDVYDEVLPGARRRLADARARASRLLE